MKSPSKWPGIVALACAGGIGWWAQAKPAAAFDRGSPQVFAVLPDGATGPEGLTVAPNGTVYVATFGFNASGAVSGSGQLYEYRPNGTLIRQVSVVGSTPHLLGLGVNPVTRELLAIDFGAMQVLKVNPRSGAAQPFMRLPRKMRSGAGLNAMTFDGQGNVYVSDSFQGVIWKTGPGGGLATAWLTSPLLTTTGVPPFGANGLAFNNAADALFVANTGNDTIVRIPVRNGKPGTPAVFVNSINGADGLIIDKNDRFWVAANQADEIDVLNPEGKVIAKLGDFNGLTSNGTPRGLLFPASPAFSTDGSTLYVTNLALDIRLAGVPVQAIDSRWAAHVSHYTVSKMPAVIPPLQ